MNLLEAPWIPVREGGGTRKFQLITYEQVLCHEGDWQVSLPRDDLELACIQLLVCMTQVMFLPANIGQLRQWHSKPLSAEDFADGIAPCRKWFDLDHLTQPFMQSRGVKAVEDTPIQKLLIGMPEGNNHAFFNEVGEVRNLGGSVAAIALFNQASNCPSFGGGFKGSLRGGAPVTTLVSATHGLRETLWRNVLPLDRINNFLPDWEPDHASDLPTWVKPIREGEKLHALSIGLTRGLFWQPCKLTLIQAAEAGTCDFLDTEESCYTGFRKEKFNFSIEGLWPHPHGAQVYTDKKEWKFVSFTTSAPAWTWLSDLLVPRTLTGPNAKEGCIPAPPVVQMSQLFPKEAMSLHLLVGGYRVKQASVIERRHELFSLAAGWESENGGRIKALVELGKAAKDALRGKLYLASKGSKDKGLKGIGAAIQDLGEKLFYARTEGLIQDTVAEASTWENFLIAKVTFANQLAIISRTIFEELTDPYAMRPELIPIIAWARRSLNNDLAKLTDGPTQMKGGTA